MLFRSTDVDNGAGALLARVIVNRLWQHHFGKGICPTSNDLGKLGEQPTDPELLDWIAAELPKRGWSLKAMHRLLVSSSTYRMAATAQPAALAKDPLNDSYWRFDRRRLTAEELRDSMLASAGTLNLQLGGPSVRPYQPAGYYRHLNFPQRDYHADTDRRQWRRGLYVHWQRMFLHPQLLAFDAPSREECTANRMRSNTPKAALVLLNDPTFVEAARKLAELAVKSGGSTDDERITFLWRRAVSRSPDAQIGRAHV